NLTRWSRTRGENVHRYRSRRAMRRSPWDPGSTDQLGSVKAGRDDGQAQPVREVLEVPDGGVLEQERRARRPEGTDPAGHRGGAAQPPGSVATGRLGDRQSAPAGDEAEPAAR